jgi:hypothetical protein
VGLEVGGEVIPTEAGIWIPDIRLGGFRNDESRLESRSHSIGEESVASRKRAWNKGHRKIILN